MRPSEEHLHPDRTDYGLAALLALAALALYVRTLAPDVLYGDSAEFQTLAYTLGTTHSTGYPVYLLLARLVGFLPLRNPAWRINLFSALCAAVSVGGVYLLTRYVAHNRVGAVLGSVALALSSTLWTQAVIAEVYTPGTAFLVVALLLLAHWQRDPVGHRRALFFATALVCLGLGVHASAVLMAPTAVLFVLWVLWSQRVEAWRRCLGSAASGFAVGLGLYFLAFALLDLRNPPSSFIQVTLYPSRSIWGLTADQFDSLVARWWFTVSGLQWRDVMFPEYGDIATSVVHYLDRILAYEFSFWMALCALIGLGVLRLFAPKAAEEFDGQRPRDAVKEALTLSQTQGLGAFMFATWVVMLIFVLNYYPGDKYVFYLPTYVLVAVAIGTGVGRVLDWLSPRPPDREPPTSALPIGARSARRMRRRRYLYPVVLVLLAWIVVSPHRASRWEALKAGKVVFAEDTYPYPVENLEEPRQHMALQFYKIPENAFMVMQWRALYTTYYLAHVEGVRPDIVIKEATPYGSDGMIAETLLEEMDEAMRAGRPVVVDQVYPGLRERYRVMPLPGGGMYRLTAR